MKQVILDIETDGLLDELTVCHSLVLRDVETGEVLSCTDGGDPAVYHDIAHGLSVLAKADRIYVHNGIRFDIPALQKLYPEFRVDPAKVRDTFIIACMRWAHIRELDFKRQDGFPRHLAGSHSLEAWGYRLNVHKGEYTAWCAAQGIADPWSTWRPEMQTYCEGDTATTLALVQQIRRAGVSSEAVDIEHALAWYLAAQERAGVPFDVDAAQQLQATLSARREALADELRTTFGPLVKNCGVIIPKRDNPKKGYVAGVPFQKTKTVEFNPGSRQDIARKLREMFGWQPSEFTNSGQPEISEKTLKGINADIPAVKLLLEYLLVEKRLGQVSEGKEAWLRHARKNGPLGGTLTGMWHIHGRVKQNHAITHRAAHANPNLGQVPKVGNPYGAECRALFTVPDGWTLIGADASSLEARCLAHYMARYDGGAYGRLLLEGDVHTENRKALGLPEGKEPRDRAKTWFYAFLYGAGDEKLGTILDPAASAAERKKVGAKLKKQFLKNTPALKRLIEDVQAKASAQGYLTLIDGRRTYVRSQHAALNTLLQSAGAIICKAWIARVYAKLVAQYGEPGWTGQWVPLLWIHDELEIAARPEIVDDVQRVLLDTFTELTAHFNWRVPLAGEAKTGRTWKDVH